MSLLVLCASAATVPRRGLHLLLVSLALALDLVIAVGLSMQRAVLQRAGMEMQLPVRGLHIITAVAATVVLIACVVAAWRRWRHDWRIGIAGLVLLVLVLTLRGLSYGTSWLMRI